jgi:uroporphyrinogen decarboxylase
MTPKERAVAALNLHVPDKVPTFELEFQLEEEMFGRKFVPEELKINNFKNLSQKDKERVLYETAEYMVRVYTELEYSIIPGYIPCDWSNFNETGKAPWELTLFYNYILDLSRGKMMIGHHGDGTFSIPNGSEMYAFAYAIADDPDGLKAQAEYNANQAIKRNKALQEAGVECLLLCSDYCYNSGPFLSPAMFSEYITPYLYKIIDTARKDGLYTIKHTDGNIMPILDQLVECRPHAIHSIDPMAGVDIKIVKEMVGDKVCLCGNVHCAALQTGTDQDVTESAEYCMTHAKPGGGYIFSTSNIPFKGMDPARYRMILDVWKRMRDY